MLKFDRAIRTYGIPVATVAAALLLMLGLYSWLELEKAPFLLFFAAIMVSAWQGGFKGGLLATILSALTSYYFLLLPRVSTINHWSDLVLLSLFSLQGVCLSGLYEALHRDRQRLKVSTQQLQESEARFRLALSHTDLMIFQQDQDLRYQWVCNPGAMGLDSVTGKTDAMLFAPAEAEALTNIKQQVLETGKTAREEVCLTVSGSKQYYDLMMQPLKLPGGETAGLTCAVVNVTLRKQIEQNLQLANRQVQSILESITDAFFALDQEWRFTYINSRFEQLGGRSRASLVGQVFWELFPEVIGSEFEQAYHQAMTERITVYVEGQGPRDSERWFSARIYPANQGLAVYFDEITERKQLEQELQRHYQDAQQALEKQAELLSLLQALLTAAPIAICFLDRELRYLQINQILADANGLPISEHLGRKFTDLFPEMAPQFVPQLQQVLESGQPLLNIEFEGTVPGQPERRNYWLGNYYPVQSVAGETVGVGVMLINVTATKEAEAALRDSEARFRAIFNQAAVGMAPITLEGQFIEANPALCAITGYSREELQQRTYLDITAPEDLEIDVRLSQQLHRGEISEFSLEKRYVRKDGSRTWVNLTSSAVRDQAGQIRYTVGVVEDISERKRIQAAQQFLVEASTLLSSSLNYEDSLTRIAQLSVPLLADCCLVDIFAQDWQAQSLAIVCSNPAQEPLFQQLKQNHAPRQDVLAFLLEKLHQGESVFRTQVSEAMLRRVAQNEAHFQLLQQLGLSSLMVVPLRSRGQLFGLLSFVMTESGRHYDADDLDLAEDVARRAAGAIDNARLYQEAQQSNRIKDEFLAVLSHELRSPLNPILGWTGLLRARQLDAKTTARALETIERNVRLQSQLIEDLLDVSRILQGKLILKMAAVNLKSVIEAALETVQLAAEAKNIRIQTDLSATGWVLGDMNRLQQVVWNLLSNAVKFTPPGGWVQIQLESLDRQIQLQVKDTGVGIDPQFIPHVFEYFRQADGSTTRHFGGLGLGLAIVHHLVELHGGTVWAESPGKGCGATFTVRLPLTSIKPMVSPELSDLVECPSLKGVRVLVVDDEADMRELAISVLQSAGASVEVAESAATALVLIQQSSFDVLLSDIGMPVMDGYMLLQHLQQHQPELCSQWVAIALTAYAGEANQELALAAGFQAHLAKPVDSEELVQTIARFVSARMATVGG